MSDQHRPAGLPATIPPSLSDAAQDHLQRVCAICPPLAADAARADLARRVFAASPFAARCCLQQPGLLDELLGGDLERSYADGELHAAATAALAACDGAEGGGGDDESLMRALRRLRSREMLRIAWRDLAGAADIDETLRDLSQLAEACIAATLDVVQRGFVARFGRPRSADGEAQSLVVLGMGKLGGLELNFSSDIDLIFAFPESGQTDGPKVVDNTQYFTRVGQRLIKLLHEPTGDGFVFRVDMRLRPFGNSGPLALSYDALETYYLTQGREWERYAMIKARPVAGDEAAAAQLNALLRPFVFRRYLDYGAFESLRELKAMIAAQVARKGMRDNVKLGPGGIREIEFIGQAFQLVRGGREPELQIRGIRSVLASLGEAGYLPASDVVELRAAYDFLRRVENRLQMVADQQTHSLPDDDEGRARLAFAMGYPEWEAFLPELEAHRARVQGHFEEVFAAPGDADDSAPADPCAALWHSELDAETLAPQLAALGFGDVQPLAARLTELRTGRLYQALTSRARQRLDQLLPQVLRAALESGRAAADADVDANGDGDGDQISGSGIDSALADAALERLLGLLRAIAGRSVYLLVLAETPPALALLARLFAASPWVADFVTRHPIVIDELLDPRQLYDLPDRAALEAEARRLLGRCEAGDVEAQMDALRQFKQANVMRVAALDVQCELALMRVSDQLTWIAETVLQVASDLVWDQMVARHGRPSCEVDGETAHPGFAIVAYGKLGGIELGYGSDLDIVFIHGSRGSKTVTEGDKPTDNAVFFARLAQKLVHFIATLTPAGSCYEVDTRLRPNGASGLLVTSLDAFAAYQREQAWTWEHQALVRARVVVGNRRLREGFERVRSEVLGRRRDLGELRREVREMRERMRRELARGNQRQCDLKQDPGAIADIEFMVQYAVLAWAREHPELLTYPDNFRVLEQLGASGLLTAQQAQSLSDAYLHYRQRGHRQALLELPPLVPRDAGLDAHRAAVGAIWAQLLEEPAEGSTTDDNP